MIPVVLEDVPGALEALEAVQYVGGVLLPPEAARQLVVAVLFASEAGTRSAAFADAADVLHDCGAHSAAHLLDMISYEMRSPQ